MSWQIIRCTLWIGGLLLLAYLTLLRDGTRSYLVGQLRRMLHPTRLLSAVEIFAALATAGISDWYDLFKAPSWQQPKLDTTVYGLLQFGTVALLWVVANELKSQLQDVSIRALSALQAEKAVIERKHEDWVRLTIQIRNVVQNKMDRFRELVDRESLPLDEFCRTLASKQQVQLILHAIYGFFRADLSKAKPEAKLRICLFRVTPDRPGCLSPSFSFDGQSHECVHPRDEFMQLADSDGVRSLAVHCYHLPGDAQMILVPTCKDDPRVSFFHPAQEEYLKSMAAFKHKARLGGPPTALVLSLDTDHEGFFAAQRSEEIKLFIAEMMKRLEFELLSAALTAKLRP